MADYSLREVFKQFGKKIFGSCVNSCVSESQNLPLAASQGKVLQDQITQLNSNFNINVHNIELSPENNNNNSITITLPRYNFLLIEYGNKNEGQSYGGNTTVICGKTNTDKPCFVPVYLNNELLGIIYMCYNVSKSIFRAHIVNNPKNSTYLIRIIGIGNKN